MHVDETVLRPLGAIYGEPTPPPREGRVSEQEHGLATYDPGRTHDVTLFIVSGPRGAVVRKPMFEPGIWRPPGGGVSPGEAFVDGAEREAVEETGLRIRLRRYRADASARFLSPPFEVAWRTHVFQADPLDEELAPTDIAEIEAARWATLEELAGPLRERLLATGRAFWRYRVALHDAALAALSDTAGV